MTRACRRRRDGVWRVVLLIGLLWLALPSRAALGAVSGPCAASFNGVPVSRIDSINSPLELGHDDILVFEGTDDAGTSSASVELAIASVRVDEGVTDYGPTQTAFGASIDLGDITPYAVGLFRVSGATDNCIAEAWVRVSGRFPFATLAGLTAAGLALGGAAGQVTAVVSRRRLSWIGAGLAGIATGFGGALVGQQFGRLQLSYWSLFLSIVGAGAIGALVALLLRERLQPRRREPRVRRRESRSGPRHEQEAAPEPVAAVDTGQMRADQFGEHTVDTKSHAISPNGEPYWCYVMAPSEVFHLDDHTRVVATLQPGKWYLAKREVGGWVHVVIGEGSEGWVPSPSVHRQD